jgi:hypothetical protein
MREKLKNALRARCPQITEKMATRYTDKYVAAVMPEIAQQYMLITADDIRDGEMDFAANKVSEVCGRYKLDGQTGYIYQLMQSDPSTSLVIRTYIGNSITHRVSRVFFNPKFKKEIMDELKSLTIELNPDNLRDLEDRANVRVEIDIETLQSYIEQTRLDLQAPKGDAYEEKLIRNLQIANELVGRAKLDDGVAYLNEYWDQIDSGRIHGHGLSLQRIPKEVRHAALGRCYRYDFQAASYALMTSLAMQIDPTLKTATLQEYVKNRSTIRKRIALDIGISEEWMKGIFTALGFGAELKDNRHNAIRKRLGQEKYHRLLCNEEFMRIRQQLDQVSDVILQSVGQGDFDWLGRTYTEVNPKDNTKRTKNQKLAWLYQCMESDAMALFEELIPATYKIKLLVHDAVYLDRPLSLPTLADIKWQLQNRYPLLNFEGDEIIPIHTDSFVSHRDREFERQLIEHRRNVAAAHVVAEIRYANHPYSFQLGIGHRPINEQPSSVR